MADREFSAAAKIRLASPGDIPLIRELLVTVISTLDIYSEAARASEIAQYDESALAEIADSGVFVVAEDDQGLCGFCFGYDDDQLLWLSWFIVAPRARARGLGAAMIEYFLEQAQNRTHKVWCDTRSNNAVSKAILRNCGFVELITIARHWYDQDFTIWQKFVR